MEFIPAIRLLKARGSAELGMAASEGRIRFFWMSYDVCPGFFRPTLTKTSHFVRPSGCSLPLVPVEILKCQSLILLGILSASLLPRVNGSDLILFTV